MEDIILRGIAFFAVLCSVGWLVVVRQKWHSEISIHRLVTEFLTSVAFISFNSLVSLILLTHPPEGVEIRRMAMGFCLGIELVALIGELTSNRRQKEDDVQSKVPNRSGEVLDGSRWSKPGRRR